MPLGWVAAAIGAEAVVGGINASEASDTASQARSQGRTIFDEQQGYAQQLAQLIADPSSVSKLPGYQFQLSQGSEAVARQMAATGFLGSGNEAAALTQYGQGLAQNFYTTQSNLLASLSGLTNSSSPSQLNAAATAANSNAFQQEQQILGQLGLFAGKYASAGGPPSAPADPTGAFAPG